jgi:glycosyltransferase involved in cell wall biosynthesis
MPGLRILLNHGKDLRLKPEGDRVMAGVESALMGLAPALARRGHEVHVFGRCKHPGRYGEMHFHDRRKLARFTRETPADVLVLIPDVLPLLMPVRARARVVWTGNAYLTGDCALTADWRWSQRTGRGGDRARLYEMGLLHPYVDKLFVGSQWQGELMSSGLGIPSHKFSVAYLGAPLEFYGKPPAARHRRRLIYTSEARRGLDSLLQLFPRVRAAAPDAELHIFGYEYQAAGPPEGMPGAVQPGVHWRGAVKKSELAAELQTAALMAYPSHFRETFCIAVAEAQAAGLPVVTSDLAALSERVVDGVDGFLIPGRPGQPQYDAAFVDAVLRLLRDDSQWTSMGAAAAEKAHRVYDWNTIAAGWEEALQALVSCREPAAPRLEPPPQWLDPAWLTITDRGETAQVPPELATQWLRAAWQAYGFDCEEIPGLPALCQS